MLITTLTVIKDLACRTTLGRGADRSNPVKRLTFPINTRRIQGPVVAGRHSLEQSSRPFSLQRLVHTAHRGSQITRIHGQGSTRAFPKPRGGGLPSRGYRGTPIPYRRDRLRRSPVWDRYGIPKVLARAHNARGVPGWIVLVTGWIQPPVAGSILTRSPARPAASGLFLRIANMLSRTTLEGQTVST